MDIKVAVISIDGIDPFRLIAFKVSGGEQAAIRLAIVSERFCDAALVIYVTAILRDVANGFRQCRLFDDITRIHRDAAGHIKGGTSGVFANMIKQPQRAGQDT